MNASRISLLRQFICPFRPAGQLLILVLMSFNFTAGQAQTNPVIPELVLQNPEDDDQDDMCIWIHPDPSQSVVITSDKGASKLFVYDLSGSLIQTVPVPGQPGNIDVRYNFPLSGQLVDIVGYNDRDDDDVVIYIVDPSTRTLSLGGIIDGGNWPSELYGFCLYRSPYSGKFYAFGSGNNSQLRQWELVDNGDGSIGGVELRTWTNGSDGPTEGMAADDETGKLYAANENDGVYKYNAEPDDPAPSGQLIFPVGSNGLEVDVEGVSIYYAANGEGYLLVSSQGSDNFKVYERQEPHNYVFTFEVEGANSTDGIDVTNVNLGPAFSRGVFTAHSGSAEVLVCDYGDLGLAIDTTYWNPRNPAGSTSGLLGDVDNDGAVNSTDALVILSYDAGFSTPYTCRIEQGFGDANEDAATNSTDALIVLSIDAGFPVPCPAGCPVTLPGSCAIIEP